MLLLQMLQRTLRLQHLAAAALLVKVWQEWQGLRMQLVHHLAAAHAAAALLGYCLLLIL
jgi:hypothetical protein